MTDVEGIERRSESPSTRASSRLSNLSNQDMFGDQEPTTKRKSPSTKRKSRNSDKENGEVNVAKNGELNGSEEHQHHNGDEAEMIEVNVVSEIEQNGNENGDENDEVSGEGVIENEKNRVANESNGDIEEKRSANGDPHAEEEAETVEASPKSEEMGQKESANESMNVNTEESYYTAECAQMDRTGSAELNTTEDNEDLESESDKEKENGGDVEKVDAKVIVVEEEKAVEKKGFFGKWGFSLSSEKKETNGHAEELSTSHLYYSSIRGRVPLSRASPNVTVTDKDTVIFRGGLKTPTTTRKLDDSFGVKSEPSKATRGELRDKPNLRKFPAKRCLNADETDEKDDSFLSNFTFAKRRKLNEEKNRTGFLRSFLWSPFKKRSEDDDILNEPEDRGTVAKASWFRSPFWFWKRCNNREEERN